MQHTRRNPMRYGADFPPRRPLRALMFASAMGLGVSAAEAARPMVTDDARIVDAGACQVESWIKRNHSDTEYWAMPACNFTGNFELAFGAARGSDADGSRTTDIALQGKTLFRPLEANDWGAGLAFGAVRHPSDSESNLIGDLYAFVPISASFNDDRLVVHTNLGWLHERSERSHRLTWGVGAEAQVTPRVWLIGETFGENKGSPLFQVGLRYWIVPDRVQLDATYGNSWPGRSQDRWVSIGLRLLSAPFLR